MYSHTAGTKDTFGPPSKVFCMIQKAFALRHDDMHHVNMNHTIFMVRNYSAISMVTEGSWSSPGIKKKKVEFSVADSAHIAVMRHTYVL